MCPAIKCKFNNPACQSFLVPTGTVVFNSPYTTRVHHKIKWHSSLPNSFLAVKTFTQLTAHLSRSHVVRYLSALVDRNVSSFKWLLFLNQGLMVINKRGAYKKPVSIPILQHSSSTTADNIHHRQPGRRCAVMPTNKIDYMPLTVLVVWLLENSQQHKRTCWIEIHVPCYVSHRPT